MGTEDISRRYRGIETWPDPEVLETLVEAQLSGVAAVRAALTALASAAEAAVARLRRGGRLVTCGATTGPSVSIDIRHLFSRQISLVGSFMGSKGELLKAAELFFDGTFTPVIDRTYPLEAAAEAQGRLEDKAQFGKIVLTV